MHERHEARAPEAQPANPSVLLVEDDGLIAAAIAGELTAGGYVVATTGNGRDGLKRAREGSFDLVIVDRMLPDGDGLSIIRAVREAGAGAPVLVLSALGAVGDRVTGLRAGGDDYLTKPFAFAELTARVEALLRRPSHGRETRLVVGPLVLDLVRRQAWREGRDLDLLPRELRLLAYMARRPGQVLTRQMMLEDVWNYNFITRSNLVDVHIGKLRRKLDAPGERALIQSCRGQGFMLQLDP